MNLRRKRLMKRLLIEELERRTLLTSGPEIAMAATAVSNNSVEDFYHSQVGTEAYGAGGVGMLDNNISPQYPVPWIVSNNMNTSSASPAAPEATSGVGQMVITTGANTPGIGSFAMPTAGPSRAGGTGNATAGAPEQLPPPPADAAIESLLDEPENPVLAKREGADKTETAQKVSSAKTAAHYAWESGSDSNDRSSEPAGASR